MAFGQEEVERRRQQREALRKQREEENLKFKTRLIIAGATVIAVAAVILLLVLGGKKGNEPSQPSTAPSGETQSVVQTEPPKGVTVIHFAAAGDLNINDKVVASGGAGMDYTDMLLDVVPLLAQADLTVMNFEGNVVGAPYGSAKASAPIQLLQALKFAGVDMLQMANSRSISNGITGLNTTLQAVRSVGLEPVGAYPNNEAFSENGGYTIWEVQGVRIAVVAFTKGMDNMALPTGSEKCVNLLYSDYSSTYSKVDTEGITSILKRIEKEKPDLTIALLHWGSEYNNSHNNAQEKVRQLMLENGVDAILGTHPHYVQEVEYDRDAGTLVAYSLGDFISDRERSNTEYSVILDLEITKDEKGKTKITGYSYTPIYTLEDENGVLRVVRIENALAAYDQKYVDRISREEYQAMTEALEKIHKKIKPQK